MKAKTTALIALLISIASFAQQGINYKAVLKDTNGNLLADTFMNVQFTIHEDTASGTIVYQEDHNYTTNANGLLIHNIGSEASPSVGVFADIDWATYQHFLQVTIAYSGGTISFDGTEFMAVPYALSAANVSGLEKITENNGTIDKTGWRLIGENLPIHESIGTNALDLSRSLGNPFYLAGASGDYSTSLGLNTSSPGFISTAMGSSNVASGIFSTAMGVTTVASGSASTSMGSNTIASSDNSLAIGTYNKDVPNSLFVVGNGSLDSNNQPLRSSALTILANGTVTAPSFDISEIYDDKALITREYFAAYNGATILDGLLDANVDGDGRSIFIGRDAGDLDDGENNDNVALGFKSMALNTSGSNNTAIGFQALNSNTSGYFNTATGKEALVLNTTGDGNVALGWNAGNKNVTGSSNIFIGTASGGSNSSSAASSNKLYINNGASDNPLIYGDFNTDLVRINGVFEVNDGTNNRFKVLQNGNVTVGGPLTILNASDATSSWRFSTQANGSLSIFRNGDYRGFFSASTGNYSSISDRRAKRNITALENGTLNKVMQLNPVSYLMKDQTGTKRNMGLISQEVQEIFPTLTSYVEGQDLLALSYTELIPILIKALQEQQGIIDSQKAKNVVQDKSIEELIARLNLIESKSSN